MADDPKRRPMQKPSPMPGRIGGSLKPVPGPTIRDTGGTLPCGCKVALDDQSKLRVFFCPPHAVAYEMLDALQASVAVLDDLANNAPADYDVTDAMEAGIKARRVLKRAKGEWR